MKPVVKEAFGAMAQGVGGTVFVIGVAAMFLARYFWLADLLTNFQVHFIACLLVCLFVLVLVRRQLTAAVLLLGTLVLALPVIPYIKLPFREVAVPEIGENEKVYRLMTYNVLQDNLRTRDVADYISTRNVDFLLIIEADAFWEKELEFELKDHYPYRFAKPRGDFQGFLFYSKHPWESIRLMTELSSPAVEAKFSLMEGELHLIGVHPHQPLRPPSAALRNEFLLGFGDYVNGLSGSVVVAGDFNVTPWSPYFQEVLARGNLRDSAMGRGLQNTWYRFPMLFCGLPIDHVLTRGTGILQRQIGPAVGSDHRPIVTDFLIRVPN